ncbi:MULTISPECIES: hypothetical protein [Shewanella]|uniref:hypothetical protein n=1 Tax=Shewanella TaxID=22 RepID=UPI000E73FC6C|nr:MULTISPECIES: hypothetical protein [Shewanella]
MNLVSKFLIGGYAYYRGKKFEHDGAINMLAITVFGMPTLIILGILKHFWGAGYVIFGQYWVVLAFVLLSFIGTKKLDRYLKDKYELNLLTGLAREIKFHSSIVYAMVVINFFIWYFLI